MTSLTTAIGFYAFAPTPYRGVAELGLIAGTGMFVSLLANLTLLPALAARFDLSKKVAEIRKAAEALDPELQTVFDPLIVGSLCEPPLHAVGVSLRRSTGTLIAVEDRQWNLDAEDERREPDLAAHG